MWHCRRVYGAQICLWFKMFEINAIIISSCRLILLSTFDKKENKDEAQIRFSKKLKAKYTSLVQIIYSVNFLQLVRRAFEGM